MAVEKTGNMVFWSDLGVAGLPTMLLCTLPVFWGSSHTDLPGPVALTPNESLSSFGWHISPALGKEPRTLVFPHTSALHLPDPDAWA